MNKRFKDVTVGDFVYDHCFYATDKWRRVTGVKTSRGMTSLSLGVSAHPTIDTRTNLVGHPEEGVAVKERR